MMFFCVCHYNNLVFGLMFGGEWVCCGLWLLIDVIVCDAIDMTYSASFKSMKYVLIWGIKYINEPCDVGGVCGWW